MVNVLDEFLNKTLIKITETDSEEILFEFSNGDKYKMYHDQDCCEYVTIEDITGNLDDLLNKPLIMAEEISQLDENADESATWTFYKFATTDGYVSIRWYGESNGYYSESVDIEKLN